MLAFVIQALLPRITHSSPWRTAVASTLPARSEPPPGSVRARAASPFSPVAREGSQRSCCTLVPNNSMGVQPRPLCAAADRAVPPHAHPSSSIARAALMGSTPAPPRSSGMFSPSRPSGAILRKAAAWKVAVRSISAAWGCTSLATNSCTVWRHICCSSVSSKSIVAPCLCDERGVKGSGR